MKILSSLILFLACLSASQAQTIRRVNNNPGITGVNVYTTAQAAHDAAAANDILIIEPSGTSYGDLTLTKPLKIYGNGYFLTINTELKADQRTSIVGTISFNTGSGGSLISGLGSNTSTTNIYGVSDITIRGNTGNVFMYTRNAANTTNTNVSNILITPNYSGGLVDSFPTTGFVVSNVTITNCIYDNVKADENPGNQNWIVRNNTFFITSSATVILVNSVFENNILRGSGLVPVFTNVTHSYNVAAFSAFSGGVGNQNNYDLTNVFLGTGVGISADEEVQIKAGSPLKTAGSGGTEVGAYGGPTPYVVSGIPAIPSIVNMVNTATGSSSSPISVTITVKSNN
jgi:hypothetical protein